jgi:translation initiation factor 2B subunit (eIF-2B alpha/beta/delta family)
MSDLSQDMRDQVQSMFRLKESKKKVNATAADKVVEETIEVEEDLAEQYEKKIKESKRIVTESKASDEVLGTMLDYLI